jgi:hypothetical protein
MISTTQIECKVPVEDGIDHLLLKAVASMTGDYDGGTNHSSNLNFSFDGGNSVSMVVRTTHAFTQQSLVLSAQTLMGCIRMLVSLSGGTGSATCLLMGNESNVSQAVIQSWIESVELNILTILRKGT